MWHDCDNIDNHKDHDNDDDGDEGDNDEKWPTYGPTDEHAQRLVFFPSS